MSSLIRSGMCAIVLVFISGCAHKKLSREAQNAADMSQWDQAYKLWEQVVAENPKDTKARAQLQRARMNAALTHHQRGLHYFKNEQWNEAGFEFKLTLSYDPENQAAADMLARVRKTLEKEQRATDPTAVAEDEEETPSFPALEPSTWEPLNLYFPKKEDVRNIYAALGRAYGINILVDTKIRSDKINLDIRNMDFLKALDTLMILNRHFFKVIDHNTIIILEDNKNNRDRYTNQIVKTFYLSNITPKDLKNHLRQLGDIKEYAANEELNAITIKGTPDQIALADRIISANDKSQPEVVIEVELLEVTKSSMRQIGMLPVSPIEGQNPYAIGVIADPVDRSDDDAANGVCMGTGAWQLAARYSWIDCNAGAAGNRGFYDGLSAGANWYWNPYTRMMFDYVHEDVDLLAGPTGSNDNFGMRWQFDY